VWGLSLKAAHETVAIEGRSGKVAGEMVKVDMIVINGLGNSELGESVELGDDGS